MQRQHNISGRWQGLFAAPEQPIADQPVLSASGGFLLPADKLAMTKEAERARREVQRRVASSKKAAKEQVNPHARASFFLREFFFLRCTRILLLASHGRHESLQERLQGAAIMRRLRLLNSELNGTTSKRSRKDARQVRA